MHFWPSLLALSSLVRTKLSQLKPSSKSKQTSQFNPKSTAQASQ